MNLPTVCQANSRRFIAAASLRKATSTKQIFRARWYLSTVLAIVMVFGSSPSISAPTGVKDSVITSIKPVHSLVSAVMAGVGEPYLMIKGATSPHTFSLRPSDAVRLKSARIVFLVDKSMEVSLAKPVNTLAANARVVMLSDAEGLVFKRLREGGTFEAHSHETGHAHEHPEDDHPEDEHRDEHSEDDHDAAHGHEHTDDVGNTAGHNAMHEKDAHLSEGSYNMHIWLDPVNAAAMARSISSVLAEVDPAHAEIYAANTRVLLHNLEELGATIDAALLPARPKPFIVLHDAYQYFEDRFGLSAAGSIIVGSEHSPSARRIRELRNRVRELGAICVFSEPQFDTRLVEVITENTQARIGVLDPLGVAVEDGPDAYFTILHDIAASFQNCLTPPGH